MTMPFCGRTAVLLLLALAGQSAWAQAPLIPPAAPLSAPATPPPVLPDGRGLLPPASVSPPLPAPVPAPGLPDLPLAAPPAPPLAPAPTRLRARLPLPAHRLVLPAVSRVAERQVLYGRSAQGRALTMFVLDNGAPDTANVTLIFGGFHGNERSTPGVIERLRRFLKQTPAAWPRRRVLLVPYANPDGWALGTRTNGRDVDINRNFPAGWREAARAARYSPGPHAASEPETQAIIALLARYHPAKIVSLHSPLHCLNWTGDLGRAMAYAMTADNHLPVKGDIGYPTPGSLGDYCGAHGIGIVTLEFAGENADDAWQENRAAFVAVINLRPFAEPREVSKE